MDPTFAPKSLIDLSEEPFDQVLRKGVQHVPKDLTGCLETLKTTLPLQRMVEVRIPALRRIFFLGVMGWGDGIAR